MDGDSGKTQWHPGFRAAMKLEFRAAKRDLKLHRRDAARRRPQHHRYERRTRDITLTLLRESPPAEMFRVLEREEGASVSRARPGVYVIDGVSRFFTRVIAYGELEDPGGEIWLRALTKKLRQDQARRFLMATQEMTDEDDRRRVNDVMFVAIRENLPAFTEIRKEGDDMIKYDAMRLLFEEEFARTKAEGRNEGMALGRSEGMALGRSEGMALGIIGMGRRRGFADSEIIGDLVSCLNVSQSDAERILHEAG